MEKSKRRSSRVQLAFPIRVRGMSTEHKFFDEKTQTTFIGKYGFMTQLRHLVNLETEIHVVNLKNDVAGTFRVVWVNTRSQNGLHRLGVEAYEVPDDIWGIYFPPVEPGIDLPEGGAWLVCKTCGQKQLGTVPQAELEYLEVGVLVARQCDQCRATTTWEFTLPGDAEPVAAAASGHERKDGADKRARKRENLGLTLKLIRELGGTVVEDLSKTIDVSHIGAYFMTPQIYRVGEVLKVILPYKKDGVGSPVSARVIRITQPKGTSQYAVAIQMDTALSLPELAPHASEADLAAAKKAQVELRTKGRVPLKLPIKVTRQVYGMNLEDVSETVNISRTGAYFQSSQNYSVGEMVQVILPFKKGEQHIPVYGRVVRLDQLPGTYTRAVAIHMGTDKK
ncbi:MAG TPA: PilZ domain-containing protein [Terriglobia bacterium]|nr:PilZ domain-containing protein [Terriglobia bacterium]